MTHPHAAAIDALDKINRTILAFIDVNERQDILSSVKKDIKKVRTALANAPQWLPIESAPKDGTVILVCFKNHGAVSCFWGTPESCSGDAPYIWCVDDFKHGPYAVRGYRDGDDTHWMPLPAAPSGKIVGE